MQWSRRSKDREKEISEIDVRRRRLGLEEETGENRMMKIGD